MRDVIDRGLGQNAMPQIEDKVVHACRLLGTAAADALMIGDSANDADAARAAGIPVLLVTYGYSEGVAVDSIECDGLISSLLDALPLIRR